MSDILAKDSRMIEHCTVLERRRLRHILWGGEALISHFLDFYRQKDLAKYFDYDYGQGNNVSLYGLFCFEYKFFHIVRLLSRSK